jgi:hypothetical protein
MTDDKLGGARWQMMDAERQIGKFGRARLPNGLRTLTELLTFVAIPTRRYRTARAEPWFWRGAGIWNPCFGCQPHVAPTDFRETVSCISLRIHHAKRYTAARRPDLV